MHYIGMLAFSLPIPVLYDLPTVLASLLAAILASGVALNVVSQKRMGPSRAVAASIAMGTGIAAMHYVGMDAMRLGAARQFDGKLVILSIILAIVISLVALWLVFRATEENERNTLRKIGSAVIMGMAIPIMHYTGMAAARFTASHVIPDISLAISISSLGTASLTIVTLVVLSFAVLSSVIDRHMSAQAVQIAYAAQHDFLTGLPNRMLLNDRVNQAIALASRHMKKVAVLFLDLDGFKHINDSLGHRMGDKLLQSIARRMVAGVRRSDTISRLGGDEFVVLLAEVERSEDVAMAATKMLQAVAEAYSIEDHDLHITASIGVSMYPDDGLDAETLIKNADIAMYQAKDNGRQSYQFFKPAMNVRAVERQSIEASLRRALERQEFSLHYQAKINLKTETITGAEALLRWAHPIRGVVPPAQFISVAEDCGLIVPIGKWALREACQQAQAWVEAGLPRVSIAVNISSIEFRDPNFLKGVFGILADTGLDPRLLELELTESVLMKHAETTESTLKTLRARGVHLAIDDFGTGYSSLSYLRKFPVDTLKIDQSFIRQITTNLDDSALVAAMIGMGRSLKLRVVAEGVETQEELAFLQAHQCDEAQGYYFSRPLPPEQFAKLLETGIAEQPFHLAGELNF